jgi:hypothetical protein
VTEFEQQVAEALTEILYKLDAEHRLASVGTSGWLGQELAPRVAAALDTLARMYVDDVWGGSDESERYRQQLAARHETALAALRGAP